MAFIRKHEELTLHTYLTQEGRRRLALGDLQIKRVAFSDDEVDYSFGSGVTYSPSDNEIIVAPYRNGSTISYNYDGTLPFDVEPRNVCSLTQKTSEPVQTLGFYTNINGNTDLSGYRVDTSLCLATAYTDTFHLLPGQIGFGANAYWFGFNPKFYYFVLSGVTTPPPTQGLLFARWIVPGGDSPTDIHGKNIGYYSNFYRYNYNSSTNILEVDRVIPRYDENTIAPPRNHKEQPLYFYPLSGYSQYYGSGTTTICPIWNMNIHNKVGYIGAYQESQFGVTIPVANDISFPTDVAYTTFGSRNYAGLIQALKLDHLPRCGIIHYTNSYSGDVYGDYLVPRETEVDIPHILWHRNGNGQNGTSTRGGLKLVDKGSDIVYDSTGKTSYTILKDGIGPSAQAVGRVYYELKTIVITDQELLTAMDPKNNRNWTCPPFQLELTDSPSNEKISTSGYTGLAVPGKRYYVTYHLVSYPGYGARQSVPCSYIQSIDGQYDSNGNPMYIKATFPPNSFPFLRTWATGAEVFSGAGHNVVGVQMLLQEVDIATDTGVLDLNPFDWKVAPLPTNTDPNAYGVSRFGLIGQAVWLSATQLNACTFYATANEFSGNTYFTLSAHANGGSIGQTLGLDEPFWQGDPEFFYGNITASKVKKKYIRRVRFTVKKDDLNTSTNSTFTSGSTYITSVYLLGSDNKVLGVCKPDRPIEKNDTTIIDLKMDSYY